ncbi:ComEC/Rec2 family competence protein [Microbacterium sp. 1P10UB]|uniref:ComEC/Rec2 family competence protein n=1 Tax=unclassified Microbacterium TaxID=2609290 RepID=UPI00399F3E35
MPTRAAPAVARGRRRTLRALRTAPVPLTTWAVAGWTTVEPGAASAVALSLWASALAALAALAVRGARQPKGGPDLSTSAGERRRQIAVVLVVVTLSAAAAAASSVVLAQPARDAAAALPISGGRAVSVLVTVTGKVERWGSDRLAFDAQARGVTIGAQRFAVDVPVAVILATDDLDPGGLTDVGATVEVGGTVRPADPGERAVLDVTAARPVEVRSPPQGAVGAAADLRTSLVAAADGLPPPGAGLLPGLAVGDTSAVDADLDTAMKASSLSHLTAVSGANCALVVGLAFAAASALGLRRGLRVTAGLIALAGFVLLVTPEPSVVRAAAMAAVAMIAVLLGRTGAGVAVVSLAVSIILVIDPWLAGSLGFALSTVATASLLLFARPLATGLGRWMPRPLALALSVPLAAQLACGPLLVLITPVVPLYGVVANLLAAPAAPLATVIGLTACLSAPLPLVQSGLAAVAWLPAAWIAGTAQTFAGLPGNAVPWLDGWAGVAALALLGLAVGIVIVGRRTDAARWRRIVGSLSATALAVAVGTTAGGAALTGPVGGLTVPAPWAITVCDVGQGDAVVIRSQGAVALIDTGPDPAPLAVCLDRLRITRVDLLVLTHFDLDHAGGAASLAGRVGLVVHGPPADAADTRLLRDLRAGGAAVTDVHAGSRGVLGGATWTVLWPRPGSKAFPPGNDAGVVVDIRGGGVPASLFLADLSGLAQRGLERAGTLDAPYEVVKVAHHGSGDQDPALYRTLGAAVALIPVGLDNDYGHPRAETLGILSEARMAVARSDRNGMICVWSADGALQVWRERGG